MNETITIKVSCREAREIYRALVSRKNYWRSPEKINQISNAFEISKTYEAIAESIKSQAEEQGF